MPEENGSNLGGVTPDQMMRVYQRLLKSFQKAMKDEIGFTDFPIQVIDIILRGFILTLYIRAIQCSDNLSKSEWIKSFQGFTTGMLHDFTDIVINEINLNVRKH